MIQMKTMYHETDDVVISPNDILCKAIILQAVYDFRAARRHLKRHPDDRPATKTVNEISRFFRSRYFSLLTQLDGPTLLRRLMED